jgi:hypothetical protein
MSAIVCPNLHELIENEILIALQNAKVLYPGYGCKVIGIGLPLSHSG